MVQPQKMELFTATSGVIGSLKSNPSWVQRARTTGAAKMWKFSCSLSVRVPSCNKACVFCSMYAKNGAKRAAAYSDDEPYGFRSSVGWARAGFLLNRRLELRKSESWKGCIR